MYMKIQFYPFSRFTAFFAVALLIPAIGMAQTSVEESGFIESFADDVLADFRHHYSRQPLTKVGIGLAVGGVLANSNADEEIQQFFSEDLASNTGDDLSNLFTGVGDVAHPLYSFPIYLGTMWLGDYNGERDSIAAQWAANSMRATLVGAPEVVILSNLIGGQTPEEGEPGWDPFNDDDGVSGHAFFGAVPIITAAKLANKRWLKYSLYATSTLPGLARVYDGKHYFSQSFLGWWIAYQAAETIERTNREERVGLEIVPVTYSDGSGLQVTLSF